MNDEQIIQLFFTRNEDAIRRTDEQYGARLTRLSENIVHSREDAQECVNDTYLVVWNRIPPNTPKSLRAFACGIARNTALDRYRANTAQKRNSFYDAALDELEEAVPALDNVESAYEAKELAGYINRFLADLSYNDRFAFVRRYYYADSVTDIARQMQHSPQRVSVRLFRIRSKLQTYLRNEGCLP